jgi:hypothetical protein
MLNEREISNFFTFTFNSIYYIPTYYPTVVLSQVLILQYNFIFLVNINIMSLSYYIRNQVLNLS